MLLSIIVPYRCFYIPLSRWLNRIMNPQKIQNQLTTHMRDYASVSLRLESCKNVILNGRLDSAASMLRKSYVNAVMSIQTAKDRHETAYSMWQNGMELKNACLETVYGGQKHGWMQRTFDKTNWKMLVLAIRNHYSNDRIVKLLEVIENNLVGVSYTKGSFVLAMVGFTEYMCIDSNCKNFLGIEGRINHKNAKEYMDMVYDVREKIVNKNPWISNFIVQWAIYDHERGEHARHMPFYRSVLTL